MFDPIEFDPALACLWPVGRGAGGGGGQGGLDGLSLETKGGGLPSPAEQSQALLNEMTTELKLQFEAFRKIRVDAEAKLASGDEAEQKIAKADIKSASDALSLIVRTIEKIDSLQRSLANDLEIAVERQFDEAAYDALLAETERQIEKRVAERVAQRLAQHVAASLMADPQTAVATGAGPPQTG